MLLTFLAFVERLALLNESKTVNAQVIRFDCGYLLVVWHWLKLCIHVQGVFFCFTSDTLAGGRISVGNKQGNRFAGCERFSGRWQFMFHLLLCLVSNRILVLGDWWNLTALDSEVQQWLPGGVFATRTWCCDQAWVHGSRWWRGRWALALGCSSSLTWRERLKKRFSCKASMWL